MPTPSTVFHIDAQLPQVASAGVDCNITATARIIQVIITLLFILKKVNYQHISVFKVLKMKILADLNEVMPNYNSYQLGYMVKFEPNIPLI